MASDTLYHLMSTRMVTVAPEGHSTRKGFEHAKFRIVAITLKLECD